VISSPIRRHSLLSISDDLPALTFSQPSILRIVDLIASKNTSDAQGLTEIFLIAPIGKEYP